MAAGPEVLKPGEQEHWGEGEKWEEQLKWIGSENGGRSLLIDEWVSSGVVSLRCGISQRVDGDMEL